jgi:hypothetical protein
MYGPGSSFKALKQRHVSSTKTGPLTCRAVTIFPCSYVLDFKLTISAALRHLSADISSMVP